MQLLIDVFGFLSVLLRGAEIAAQSIVVGGVAYLLCLVRPLQRRLPPARPDLWELCARWVRRAALWLAAIVAVWLAVDGTVLGATADLSPLEISGASFFIAGLATIGAALTMWWLVG